MNEMETINIIEDEKVDYRDPNLTGIGGWLIVMLVGICISIVEMLYSMFSSFGFGIFTTITVSVFLPFILLYIFLLITMVKKLHFFPLMYFIVIIALGAFNLFIDLYSGTFGFLTVVSVVSAVAWSIYIKKSVRVSNTFVRNWQGIELEHKVFDDYKM